jgi:hypothetical protein
MYKKISQDSVDAFLNKQLFKRENMEVVCGGISSGDIWYLLLHGNRIAKMLPDGTITLYTCGWHTRTTLERLNCLLYTLGKKSRLRIRKGAPYLETNCSLTPWFDGYIVAYKVGTKLI